MFACMYVDSFTKPELSFFLLKDDVLDCLETQQEMRNEIKVCILGILSKDPKYMAYVIPQTIETLRCRTGTRRRRQMQTDSNKLLYNFKSISFVIDFTK